MSGKYIKECINRIKKRTKTLLSWESDSLDPAQKEEVTRVKYEDYRDRIRAYGKLLRAEGKVAVYPSMGDDVDWVEMGVSELIGIDTADDGGKYKGKVVYLKQDAAEIPDKVKQGYDILIMKTFSEIIGVFPAKLYTFEGESCDGCEGDDKFEDKLLKLLDDYLKYMRPGGAVVVDSMENDRFKEKLTDSGFKLVEVPEELEFTASVLTDCRGGGPKNKFYLYSQSNS